MDKEAMRAAAKYQQMVEQHYKGGYFSPFVIERAKTVSELALAQKEQLYKDSFAQAWELTEQLKKHSKYIARPGGEDAESGYQEGYLDLRQEGLGIVSIYTVSLFVEGGSKGYRSIDVNVDAFFPVPDINQQYKPGLGFESASDIDELNDPPQWGRTIYLEADGTVPEDMLAEIDMHILHALDSIETLQVAKATGNYNQEEEVE